MLPPLDGEKPPERPGELTDGRKVEREVEGVPLRVAGVEREVEGVPLRVAGVEREGVVRPVVADERLVVPDGVRVVTERRAAPPVPRAALPAERPVARPGREVPLARLLPCRYLKLGRTRGRGECQP